MSIIGCTHYSALVNTDDDPEAFCDVIAEGNDGATTTVCLCLQCREQLEAELYPEDCLTEQKEKAS